MQQVSPSYTPNPEANTRTLLIYRDECGILHANDVEMGRDVKNSAGSSNLSEAQVEKISKAYEARGYTVLVSGSTVDAEIERIARHFVEHGRVDAYGRQDPGDWDHIRANKPFSYSQAVKMAKWALSATKGRD